jgi:hypothetical protein
MTNGQSPQDQEEDSIGYALGEISANMAWLINSINKVDRNISDDRDKIALWKSLLEEKVTLALRCTKDLKTGARDLENWKSNIDNRLIAQENWKAQHSTIENWKTDKENRLAAIEKWKSEQSGAQNLIKFAIAGLAGALATFLFTKLFP